MCVLSRDLLERLPSLKVDEQSYNHCWESRELRNQLLLTLKFSKQEGPKTKPQSKPEDPEVPR